MLARHGVDPVNRTRCKPQMVRVTAAGQTRWAVQGCVCGLAEFRGVDEQTVGEELLDEQADLEVR